MTDANWGEPSRFLLQNMYVGMTDTHSHWYWLGMCFKSEWINGDPDESQMRDACAWLEQNHIDHHYTYTETDIGTMHNGDGCNHLQFFVVIPNPDHAVLFRTFHSSFKPVEGNQCLASV